MDITQPPTSSSTATSPSTSTSTEKSSESINTHPYPIVSPSTIPQDIETIPPNNTPSKTDIINSGNNYNKTTNYTITADTIKEAVLTNIASPAITGGNTTVTTTITATTTTQRSTRLEEPGKIKVQIIEMPASAGKVPGEDTHEQSEVNPQGDILHVRKCASGFSRDKRGRCRRVRKPSTGTPQL